MLYQHFGGKLELFSAVLVEQAARMRARLVGAAEADPDDPFGGIARSLGERVREPGVPVVPIPYDRHLAQGGPIHTAMLGRSTREAAVSLAAETMRRAVSAR